MPRPPHENGGTYPHQPHHERLELLIDALGSGYAHTRDSSVLAASAASPRQRIVAHVEPAGLDGGRTMALARPPRSALTRLTRLCGG